jgi:hypothetical protein
MSTYRNGSVRTATPNSVTAAKRSAENRRCPACGRKSALRWCIERNGKLMGWRCRWDDCDHSTVREV